MVREFLVGLECRVSRWLVLCLVSLLAVGSLGCGGGENPGPNVSDAEFKAQATAVCNRDNDEVLALPKARNQTTYQADLIVIESFNDELYRGLRQLKPPAKERRAFDELIGALFRENNVLYPELKSATAHGNTALIQKLSSEIDSDPAWIGAATKLGLPSCAQTVTPEGEGPSTGK